VRALLFDSAATRVEGFGAQLPSSRPDAALDCLDEMHRQVQRGPYNIGAIVGLAAGQVSEADRKLWPAFANAQWLAALPAVAAIAIGSGCLSRERFSLFMADRNALSVVVAAPAPQNLPEPVSIFPIDQVTCLLTHPVPDATAAYAAARKAAQGSLEALFDSAQPDDERLAALNEIARSLRKALETLSALSGPPADIVATGPAMLKSPAWTRRITDALDTPVVLCTEPEPAARGAALWALHKIGAIPAMTSLEASAGGSFVPRTSQS